MDTPPEDLLAHDDSPPEPPLARPAARRSVGVVVLGAALLLALGSTGGAVAGSLITGKQIKNGTITTADIKNRTITTKDLTRSALPRTGATGARGPAGPGGAPGPRGLAAWDVIPSGLTVTGPIEINSTVTGALDVDTWQVMLPATAPTDLTSSTVNFAPGQEGQAISDPDPTCTGSPSLPTAPAGKVCVYLQAQRNAISLEARRSNLAPRQAFRILWDERGNAGEDLIVDAVWAYTAP